MSGRILPLRAGQRPQAYEELLMLSLLMSLQIVNTTSLSAVSETTLPNLLKQQRLNLLLLRTSLVPLILAVLYKFVLTPPITSKTLMSQTKQVFRDLLPHTQEVLPTRPLQTLLLTAFNC